MVAPTCFGITLPSSGSVPSAFWEMLNWRAVNRILWMGMLCLVMWCVAICDVSALHSHLQGAFLVPPSAFWEMLNWGAVYRILRMGVLCLVTWCVAICWSFYKDYKLCFDGTSYSINIYMCAYTMLSFIVSKVIKLKLKPLNLLQWSSAMSEHYIVIGETYYQWLCQIYNSKSMPPPDRTTATKTTSI
jgi:hypothetical protein